MNQPALRVEASLNVEHFVAVGAPAAESVLEQRFCEAKGLIYSLVARLRCICSRFRFRAVYDCLLWLDINLLLALGRLLKLRWSILFHLITH